MIKRGMSISAKLGVGSGLLLLVAVGTFGVFNAIQTRRIIDNATQRLKSEYAQGMRRCGKPQMRLLIASSRVALQQKSFGGLQAIVRDMIKRDERVLEIVLVDPAGQVLVSHDPSKIGTKAVNWMQTLPGVTTWTESHVKYGGTNALIFAAPVGVAKRRVGIVAMAFALSSVQKQLEEAEQAKEREMTTIIRNTLVLGLFLLVLAILVAIVQGISISTPIKRLAEQATKISKGDLRSRVEVERRDELGVLGDRFNLMTKHLITLLKQTTSKATMEKELEVAAAIQATLVPDASLIELDGLRIAGHFEPATQCGGDWWSYYRLPDKRVLLLIGDVTGHGVASAMITAAVKGAVNTMVDMSDAQLSLSVLLRSMNSAINDAAKGKFTMTCFAAIYDAITRELTYANAGHNLPYIYEQQSQFLQTLVASGNRLGDLDFAQQLVETRQLESGDTLVFYTDGIVECENRRSEQYGDRRFRSSIKENGYLDPVELRDALVDQARRFRDGAAPKDDLTVVVTKVD
jgi:sigma-B regulation protein RsbU (phosphoserine phosphatase)